METGIESDHRSDLGRLAAFAAAGLLVFAVFLIGLCANARALADGYRASEGAIGTPGEAVVTAIEDKRDGQFCHGSFIPGDGGRSVEARVEVRGECEMGQRVEARLAPEHASPFVGDDRPRAWEPGARDWGLLVPFVAVFAAVCAVAALVAVTSLIRAARIVRGRT